MTRVRGDYQMDFEKLSIPLTSFYSCFNASDGADVVRFKLRVHNCQTSNEFHPAESWKRVPSRRFTTVAANINGNRKTKVSRHADILTYLEGAWPLSVQVTRVTQTLATITKLSYDQRTDTVQSCAKISFLHSLLLTVWLFVYWYNFWPLCRECNKTNFHRCPPIEQMDELPVSDPCVWTKICGIATRQTLRIPREKCRAKGWKRLIWREFNFFSAPTVIRQKDRGAKGQIVAHAPMNSVRRVRRHWDPFSFQLGDRHLFCNIFWRGIRKMTSLPVFLSLWILEVFAGPSDENISMIKVQKKYEKSPETLRFDLLKIKMCRGDSRPWRLVLRCWCFTCKIKLYVKTIVRYLVRWKRLI